MKIAFIANAFFPSVGGYETAARLCAEGFATNGHDVTVLTLTPDEASATEASAFPFRVVRRPSRRHAFSLFRRHDVTLMFNIALRQIALPLLARRPLVISHHGFYGSPDSSSILRRLRFAIARFARHIFASQAVAAHVGLPGTVIHSPYDTSVFRPRHEIPRTKDILFAGRLVKQKGVDVLIRAVAARRQAGIERTLTVCGDGPERQMLERLARECNVSVEFSGVRRGAELSQIMNAHKLVVVPSRPTEGFGIVALEAIASGCFVIGSDIGGVPEAIGPCGAIFPCDDITALARLIDDCLDHRFKRDNCAVDSHLAQHTGTYVVNKYLEVLQDAYHQVKKYES